MSYDKPIRRVAIVGTGVIGASWAAQYLARGFDVVATDPAPKQSEPQKYVADAWPALDHRSVSARLRTGCASPPAWRRCRRPTSSGNGPSVGVQDQLFARWMTPPLGLPLAPQAPRDHMRVSYVQVLHAQACVVGHPFNPPHHRSSSRRRHRAITEAIEQAMRVLPRSEEASPAEGAAGTRREQASGRALSGGRLPHQRGRPGCRRGRRRRELGTGPPLGRHGPEPTVARRRRRGWDQALHGASDGSAERHDEDAREAGDHPGAQEDDYGWGAEGGRQPFRRAARETGERAPAGPPSSTQSARMRGRQDQR